MHRGRPRTFERKTALDAAMLLFWERGFEQTCVDDLSCAMGIQTSSLYSTFGDKEALFLEAVEHYRSGRGSVFDAAVIAGKTAKEAVENLFTVTAKELTREDQPKSCMLCVSLPTCSPKYEHLKKEMDRLRALSDAILLKKLEEGVRNKEIPKSTNLRMLVSFFRTTLWGMSLQAQAGASRETLLEIGRFALQAWPCKQPSKASAK